MFSYLCSRYGNGTITEAQVRWWVGKPGGITQAQADEIISSGGNCGSWMAATADAEVG